MYHNRGRYRPKRNNYSQSRSGGRGGFRIKTFDPTKVVANASDNSSEYNYEVKHAFADFPISDKIKANIASRGYTVPTPIQDQVIGPIAQGKDVVGIANTGTGKTGAFLIPLIDKVYKGKHEKVLVVVPTRELAVQIDRELRQFDKGLGIRSVVCIGGVSLNTQIGKLQSRPTFVIGTPGRLLDLSRQRALNLGSFRTLVIDEVDRMLDMGFVHDMKKIIHATPQHRQTLAFSATMRIEVLEIMQEFTRDPLHISVKSSDSTANVKQEIVKINGQSKYTLLTEMLDRKEFAKVLVFARTKRGVEKLSRDLVRDRYMVSAIHGNKSQGQRQRSLDEFKTGRVNILIATDVVARGIDVDNITHVINYELPETYEDYHHRIGRTGRAGGKGVAITFV